MKRIYMIARNTVVGAVAWVAAMQLALPWPAKLTVLLAPLLLLMAFGLNMLALLVHGALTFRSCPEEAKVLHQDIRRARDGLIAQGYKFGAERDTGLCDS